MEARSELGASLSHRQMIKGRLNAVGFNLIGENRECPQKILKGSGGATSERCRSQCEVAITGH